MHERDSEQPKTKTLSKSSFLEQGEDLEDLQAFSNLMKRGVEDPDDEFEKITQEIFDEIDADD